MMNKKVNVVLDDNGHIIGTFDEDGKEIKGIFTTNGMELSNTEKYIDDMKKRILFM